MATVVAIDDRADDLRLLSTLLTAAGHDVVGADSPVAALEVIDERKPDLVVSDILMPEIDGLELLRRLRANAATAGVRFIFCSALYNDQATNALARELGVSAMLTKPLEPSSFLTLVSDVLAADPPPVPTEESVASARLSELNATLFEKLTALEHSNRELELARTAAQAAATRARQQEALVKLGGHALRGMPVDGLVETAVAAVASELEVPLVRMLEVLSSGDFHPRAGVGWPTELMERTVPPDSLAGAALASHEAVVLDEIPPHQMPALCGAVCGAIVLCGSPDAPYGLVTAYSIVRRHFSHDDLFFLQGVANVLAEAIARNSVTAELNEKVRELSHLDAERKLLISRLLTAQEEERQRIAADVHDDSTQVMTALVLRLGLLERQVADPEVAASLAEASEIARRSITRLRHLMFELRPPALERDGLRSALNAFIEELSEHAGFESDFDYALRTEPADTTRAALYRITREALTNASKHAEAARVHVELAERDDGILATIADDGHGFDPGAESGAGHLGTATMQERAEMLGGWLEFESAVGAGTTIRCWLPANRDGDAA